MSNYPSDLKYSKEHEWCRITGNLVQIGVTHFAVEQLGDVTQLELPELGETFDQDQVFGSVESVKAVSDMFAPLTGKVTKVNDALHDSPELVNDATYSDGWMIELEVTDTNQVESLMSQSDYLAYLKEQEE